MYTDITAEWRLLSTLIDSPEVMHSITKQIFTEERQDILESMRSAYIKYGELTYEGLRIALRGKYSVGTYQRCRSKPAGTY